MSIVRGIKFKKDFRCFPKGATIDFEGANFVVILGENGSGKTTLLQAIDNEFKKESFFDRKNEDLKKSCNVILDEKIDPKKSMSLMLDYLHSNPKNAAYFSDDADSMMIELHSIHASSGQATQMGLGNKMGKFLMNSAKFPSVILFDQPETALDVGSMTQICFILMMRLLQENRQLLVATHSSDWLKAMHLAHLAVGEEIQSKISFRFIDLEYPEIRIESMEQAVMLNSDKQINALNRYIEKMAQFTEASDRAEAREKKAKEKKKAKEQAKASKDPSDEESKPKKPKRTSGRSKKSE